MATKLDAALERIDVAVDRIRTKVSKPTESIEEVATAVEALGTGGSEPQEPQSVYKVKTFDEMMALKDVEENATCIILDSSSTPAKPGDTIQTVTIPNVVVLPEAITAGGSFYEGDLNVYYSASYMDISYYGYSTYLQIMYSSTDGITYTKDLEYSEPSDELITLDEAVTLPSNMPEYLGYFFVSDSTSFEGIHTYKPTDAYPLKDTSGNDIIVPSKGYELGQSLNLIYDYTFGENGVINYYKNYIILDSDNFTNSSNYFYIQNNNLYLNYGNTSSKVVRYSPGTYTEEDGYSRTSFTQYSAGTTLIAEGIDKKPLILATSASYKADGIPIYDSSRVVQFNTNAPAGPSKVCLWAPASIGISVKQRDVVDGVKVFCDSGVITGNLGADRAYKANEANSDFARINKTLMAMFDSEEGVDLSYLAYQNYELGTVPILKCVKKVKTLHHLLYHHRGITSVDVSSFDLAPYIAGRTDTRFYMQQSFQGAYDSDLGQYVSELEEIIGLDKWGPQFPSGGRFVMSNMFSGNPKLKRIDLSTWTNMKIGTDTDIEYFVNGCSSLEFLDIRHMNVEAYDNSVSVYKPFDGIPNNCLIIVKGSTQKSWFSSKYPNLTNVKTVAEYGG